MTSSTITLILWCVTALVLTVLIGRRVFTWNKARRDELARQQADLDAALAQNSVPFPPTPQRPVVPAGELHSGALHPSSVNGVWPPASAPATPPTNLNGASLINPERFQTWTPADAGSWQPPVGQPYQVSWGHQQLFRTKDENFEEPGYIPKIAPDQVPSTSTDDYAFGPATPVMAELMLASSQDLVERELKQAGFYQPHALQNLQATRFALVTGSILLLGGLLAIAPKPAELPILIAMLIIPGLMWAVPRVVIQNRATNRRSELERAMPDMLDMLNMCVSQGLTIPASMRRISIDLKPVYPVLATELGIVVHQAGVGNMRVALDNFAKRVDVPEVDSFVSLINQSERMGTSISDALTEYSNTMRESLRQRTDEKANKASFKLMFPTVLFMMPAVFMFLLGPAILELQTFFDRGGMESLQQDTEQLENLGSLGQINAGN